MCGIVGYVGDQAAVKLLNCLTKLAYRGYDSCGIAVLENQNINFLKSVGAVEDVSRRLNFYSLTGKIGIAHTRWATHGGVTNNNAHPLLSNDENFALVHNGVISNYEDIKINLLAKGYKFTSQTDSEVLVNLLEENYKQTSDIYLAVKQLVKQVVGCYSISIVSTYMPDTIIGIKFMLPLVLGIGDGSQNFIASDITCFSEYTHKVVLLNEGEYVFLKANSYEIYDFDGNSIKRDYEISDVDDSKQTDKGKFEHYMLKEIFDQPTVISNVLLIADDVIEKVAKLMLASNTTHLVGIGTTYYVSLMGVYFLRNYARYPAAAFTSDEFILNFLADKKLHVLFISQSGETFDTKKALSYVKEYKTSNSAIVNSLYSTISRSADYTIFQNSGAEISVVSTKAAFAQVLVLSRIALMIGVKKGMFTEQDFKEQAVMLKNLSKQLNDFLPTLSVETADIAAKISHYRHMLLMGKGIYYPLASELALKIKEVSYIHAEAMPTGFLKHGNLALVDDAVLCCFLVPPTSDKNMYEDTLNAIEEVKARNGKVLGICEHKNQHIIGKLDYILKVPESKNEGYIAYHLVLGQLLAYYLAKNLGRDIDKPRNLAKSVTVP